MYLSLVLANIVKSTVYLSLVLAKITGGSTVYFSPVLANIVRSTVYLSLLLAKMTGGSTVYLSLVLANILRSALYLYGTDKYYAFATGTGEYYGVYVIFVTGLSCLRLILNICH